MNVRTMATWGLILLTNQFVSQRALADASFQSTTQITGGTLADSLKHQPFMAKSVSKMFAPMTTQTMVRGNQKATVSKESIEIIDLDEGTITHIDMEKKTYTVMTFAQLRQAMADMPKQMQQAQAQMKQSPQPQMPQTDLKTSFDVKVNNTGASKMVNGLMAQEQLITMSMHITDPNAAANAAVNQITYTITTDVWIAPDPPAVKEIQDFDLRMGKKMMEGVDLSAFVASMKANANAGMMGMFGGQPGAAAAMEQMGKEMAKLKGTRVMEVTSMGGGGTGPGMATTTSAPPPPPSPTGGSVAGQVASDTATQTAAGETSKMGTFGSALGGSMIGAFRRKKAASAPPPATPAPATTQATAGGTATTASAVLMETTTQQTNFSQEPISPAVFQIPSGFTQVPSAYERMNK